MSLSQSTPKEFFVRRRLTGATLALLLQALFIALLMQSMRPSTTPEKLARELTLILPRLRQTEPARAPATNRPPSHAPATPWPPVLPAVLSPPTLPSAPSQENLRGVGEALFGCAPETWSSLTPQQRSQCTRPGEGVTVLSAPNLMGTPDHVKDEAHWDDVLAHEHSPLWTPCTGPGYKPTLADVGLDLNCMIVLASQGALTDPRQWPVYRTTQLPKGDFYKIEQAYDAWHKAHPGTQESGDATQTAPGKQ